MTMRLAGKYLSILVAVTFLLGMAGCGIGKIFPNGLFGCTSNCSTSTAPPEFLFATSAGHIASFTVNQSNGGLSAPLVVAGPGQSAGMSGSVTEGYLYVSDFLNDAVDGYSMDPSSGALTLIASSPFALGGAAPGGGGLSMFLQGGDTFLYATDMNAGTVAGFNYDSASGTLTTIPGSPFPAGDSPVQAVQNGFFLYVSDLNDSAGGISAYALSAQNGAATPLPGSPFPTGAPGSFPGPSALAIMNNFLYVALAGTATPGNQVAAFAINSDGSLTPVPGSPFTTGSGPTQIASVPVTSTTQAFLYTANVQDGTISAFTANDSNGILTPVSGSPYTSGTSIGSVVASLTFTDSGNFFLYASDPQAETINAFTVDATTGALTPISGSPFPAGSAATLLTVVTNP
ncbi:MAG TPA: beta-propeller fold lactonase family protein [Candidatus Sulfotelmatobacter sp.]